MEIKYIEHLSTVCYISIEESYIIILYHDVTVLKYFWIKEY